PSGSTIDGVKAYIYKWAQRASGAPRVADATIQLIVGGSRVGDNKANTTPDWDSTEDVYEYGGDNDLWGLILSDSDVNASNFGIAIRAANTYTAAPISLQARVYHIKMQVSYTPPSGNPGAMFMLFSVKDRIREIIEASKPKLWLPEV